MFVFDSLKLVKPPKKQGKWVAKIPMKMIFIDEIGQGFEHINGEFIYRFCTYIEKKTSLSL